MTASTTRKDPAARAERMLAWIIRNAKPQAVAA